MDITWVQASLKTFYDRCIHDEEDYYQLLGVPHDAGRQVIQDAYTRRIETFMPYKKLVRGDHEMGNELAFVMNRLDYIYEVLMDAEKRTEYDKRGYLKEEDPSADTQETPVLVLEDEPPAKEKVSPKAAARQKTQPVFLAGVPKKEEKSDPVINKPAVKPTAQVKEEPARVKGFDPVEKAKEHYKLGKSLYDQRAYPMAMSALKEAMRLDPGKALYYHQVALCQAKIKNMRREAEKNLRKAIELEAWNAEHYAALGMLYLLENLYHRAESYFKQALQYNPENALALKGLEKLHPEKDQASLKDVLKKVLPSIFDKD